MSAEPTVEQDKARLARLMDVHERTKGDAWGFYSDEVGMAVTSRRAGGEERIIGRLTADASSDEIELFVSAHEILRQFVRSYRRSVSAFRDLKERLDRVEPRQEPALRDGNFAANAAITLDDRRFWRFLEQKGGGPVRDKAAADARLKSLLNITSKTELNENVFAQTRWIDLRSEYEAWLRGDS